MKHSARPLDGRHHAALRLLAARGPLTSRELANALGLEGDPRLCATEAAVVAVRLRREGLVASSTAGWEATTKGRQALENGGAP